MRLEIKSPGMLTTVQDLGRWGHQAIGMPVAGAMDPMALKRGNLMVKNPLNAAALEITVMGPSLTVHGSGLIVLTGADLGMAINGVPSKPWRTYSVQGGDGISFSGMKGQGCRGYLCVSGGIDVPSLMGSRSTYLRGKIGGYMGRALAKGDVLTCGEPYILWDRCAGFACPEDLRPSYDPTVPLNAVLGPQEDCFTEEGIQTFLSGEYAVSPAADRMGYRMDGPKIDHLDGADIVSDGICLGAVQVPGHGQPIVMMADRQTTGGYTKIAVITGKSVARLAQRLPGESVRFQSMSQDQAIQEAKSEAQEIERLRLAVEGWIASPREIVPVQVAPASGRLALSLEGQRYDVTWERL